jgi:hypothetical protein
MRTDKTLIVWGQTKEMAEMYCILKSQYLYVLYITLWEMDFVRIFDSLQDVWLWEWSSQKTASVNLDIWLYYNTLASLIKKPYAKCSYSWVFNCFYSLWFSLYVACWWHTLMKQFSEWKPLLRKNPKSNKVMYLGGGFDKKPRRAIV